MILVPVTEGKLREPRNWKGWYDVNIPLADKRYDEHLAELDTREYR
jgi:hypothetical protein